MPYGLVYYPNFEIVGLDEIRRRHDPTADLIEPHMGVMFLIPDSVGEGTVVRHLEDILQRLQPFAIRFHGLTKSWDHWLFLTLQEGNAEVLQLYDEIYSGPIARYRYDDVEFIPHVAIGLFAKNADGYDHQGTPVRQHAAGVFVPPAERTVATLLDVVHLRCLTEPHVPVQTCGRS